MEEQTITPLEQVGEPKPRPSFIQRIKDWYRGLPDKKKYLEFITALLTIPVLLTVFLGNLSNLRTKDTGTPSETPVPSQSVIIQMEPSIPNASAGGIMPPQTTQTTTPSSTPTPIAQCIPEVGPVAINYPVEGSTVSTDPVCLTVSREGNRYCSIVWSYRINGGSWSDYTDKEICMYGLTSGLKELELRFKSIVSGEEKILERTFTVQGTVSPTPATQSGMLATG